MSMGIHGDVGSYSLMDSQLQGSIQLPKTFSVISDTHSIICGS